MLSPPLLGGPSTTVVQSPTTQNNQPGGSAIHDSEGGDDEDKLDVSPGALQDLGRLGEGASGEVRKVLHKPTGLVMAKKVSLLLFSTYLLARLNLCCAIQTIMTSPNPKLHKQHLRELSFMRDCTDPHIVQYYGAFLESVRPPHLFSYSSADRGS
jgi:mitogen-activated protein kinase kinase